MERPVDLEKEKILPSRRAVFNLNGSIIVAYNTNQPYPLQLSPNPDSPVLHHLHLPSYESNNAPYLCAAPAVPEYTGSLLGRLKQTDTQFPIDNVNGKFRLELSLAESWLSLEKALEIISVDLLSSVHPFVSLDYLFPPCPSEYGYTRSFNTRHGALIAAQKSRDAFQFLIAHIAWSAILHRSRAIYRINFKDSFTEELGLIPALRKANFDLSAEECKGCDDGWMSMLQRKHNAHPAIIHALCQSTICDFSIRRAGLVIRKPQDWIYINVVPYLILSNIPVWIVWGESKAPMPSIGWPVTVKETYGPSSYERTFAHTWSGSSELGFRHDLPSAPTIISASTDQTISTHTNVEKLGRHHKVVPADELDIILEWIRKRKADIESAMIKATPIQLQRYTQRQRESEKFECPGRKGATVYEWERDERNSLTRTLISRALVPQVWSLYGNKQRWFNCVRNEWELCQELDPGDTPCDTDSDLQDEVRPNIEDESDGAYHDSPTAWKEKPIHCEDRDINACLLNPHIPLSSEEPSPSPNIHSDALKLLTERFGFAFERGSAYATVAKRQWSLSKTLVILGDRKGCEMLPYECEGLESSIIHFVMHLAAIGHPDAKSVDVPSGLCDLYVENPCYIARVRSSIRIQTVDAGGIPLYMLHHLQDNDLNWTLAVSDPCTALMAIRLDLPSITEFAITLIHSRTPFLTLRKADTGNVLGTSMPSSRHKQRRFGLGERPPGHKLDKSDYIVYEAERIRLLENKRIARAAVKRGGILSRLVSESVDDCEILDGPSSSALELPFKITIGTNGEQVSYFDDSLSDEEISLLVGLYSIKSGRALSDNS